MNALLLAAAMKIAVLQLSATGVERALADNLSEVMLASIHELGRYAALGKSDIEAMLGFEAQRQLLGCADESASCLAELGGALGVEKIVAGSVGRIDDDYLLNLRIVDIRRGQVIASQLETVSGKASQLIGVMRRAVPQLFAKMEATQAAAASATPAVPAGPAPVAATPPPPAPTTPAPAVSTPPPAPAASPPPPTAPVVATPAPVAPPVPAAALEPTPPAPAKGGPSILAWIGAGGAAVGVVMGGLGFAMRESAMDTYRSSVVPSVIADARGGAERGNGMFLSGLVMAGVGAAVAVAGFTGF